MNEVYVESVLGFLSHEYFDLLQLLYKYTLLSSCYFVFVLDVARSPRSPAGCVSSCCNTSAAMPAVPVSFAACLRYSSSPTLLVVFCAARPLRYSSSLLLVSFAAHPLRFPTSVPRMSLCTDADKWFGRWRGLSVRRARSRSRYIKSTPGSKYASPSRSLMCRANLA